MHFYYTTNLLFGLYFLVNWILSGHYLSDSTFEKLKSSSVLGISDLIKALDSYYGCGYVLEPDSPDLGFGEELGITVKLSNTETPEIMNLGYTDLTSGNGVSLIPLSKVPGKKDLLTMLGGCLSGKKNYVYANKADAEKFVHYLEGEYQLEAETTPFSRLSYEGKTFNWVPSSNFEPEYNIMLSAIAAGTAEFGTCWTECSNQLRYQVQVSATPAPTEEPTEFTVTLESVDASKKIAVIKAIREVTGLGLGEAKTLVESAPKVVKSGVNKTEADDIIRKLEEAGGKASKKGVSGIAA